MLGSLAICAGLDVNDGDAGDVELHAQIRGLIKRLRSLTQVAAIRGVRARGNQKD